MEVNTLPIKSLIRTIPDYPKPGVQFRDITTLLKDADGLRIIWVTSYPRGNQVKEHSV